VDEEEDDDIHQPKLKPLKKL